MKKTILFIILSAMTSVMAISQTKIYLKNGDRSVTATLTDNNATQELIKLLSHSDITVSMSDYGGFEKVGALPQSLPTSNSQITTVAGDIMLYQGYNMVIFYGSNSWSYTRLGKIDGATPDSVHDFLGNGNVSITLSLNGDDAGIEEITAESNDELVIYDIHGRRIESTDLTGLPSGLYIVNGKKIKI